MLAATHNHRWQPRGAPSARAVPGTSCSATCRCTTATRLVRRQSSQPCQRKILSGMREQTAMSCSFNRTRRFPAYSINWPNLTIPFVLPAITESGLGADHSRSATFSLDSRLNYALSTMPGKGGPFSIASAFKWADRLQIRQQTCRRHVQT